MCAVDNRIIKKKCSAKVHHEFLMNYSRIFGEVILQVFLNFSQRCHEQPHDFVTKAQSTCLARTLPQILPVFLSSLFPLPTRSDRGKNKQRAAMQECRSEQQRWKTKRAEVNAGKKVLESERESGPGGR